MNRGYRPALDGVRAIAVLAVIAYHLGLPVAGGYLGVDVFFVLSGYLITDLLLSEHTDSGRVRLANFWARRARRLLPALLLLVAACAIEAWWAEPLIGLGPRRGDMLATLAYAANWHFIATDQSYFAVYTGASPLRHMWSLAIEEQFYLAWPLLLVLVLRRTANHPRLRFVALALAIAGSATTLALEYNSANSSRAYLGTDGRAHELLIGALLAFALRSGLGTRVKPGGRLVPVASLMAFLLTLGSMAIVSDISPEYYRGGSTVFCAIVAVWLLTVEVDPECEIARLLSARPLVPLGRISYGLYLWHWPFVLWLHAHDGGFARQALCLGATAVVAGLSYVLVEAPIRAGRAPWLRTSTRRVAIAVPLGIAAAAVLAVAATASAHPGIVKQLADQSIQACPRPKGWCVRAPRPPGGVLVAVVGDSTSLALDPGMRAEAARRGFGYVQGGRKGCSFLPLALQENTPAADGLAQACAQVAGPLLDDIATQTRPDIWLVSDRYILTSLHANGRLSPIGRPEHDQAVVAALHKTLLRLTASDAKVVLLEMPPAGQPVDCVLGRRRSDCRSTSTSLADPATMQLNALLRNAAAELPGRVAFLRIEDLVCSAPDGQCGPLVHGIVARYDGIHYTGRFSRLLVPQILDRVEWLTDRSQP